jgi:outer membrane protein
MRINFVCVTVGWAAIVCLLLPISAYAAVPFSSINSSSKTPVQLAPEQSSSVETTPIASPQPTASQPIIDEAPKLQTASVDPSQPNLDKTSAPQTALIALAEPHIAQTPAVPIAKSRLYSYEAPPPQAAPIVAVSVQNPDAVKSRAHDIEPVADRETLEQAFTAAYQNNPSLEAARAGVRASDEAVSQAQSHWRPSVDATSNIGKTYQYIPAQKPFGTQDFADTTRGYGVQVTQPLFRGWRTDSETDAADNKVLSGRAKLRDAEQQLFLDTATAFLDVIRDQAVVDYQRVNEHVLEERLKEIRERTRAGESTHTDIHQAESRLARAQVGRFQSENALTQDRAAYARLVGRMPEHLVEPNLTVDNSHQIDDVLHLAETRNPKVVAAEYDKEEADDEVSLNKGSLLPEINIVGNSSRNWGQSSTLPGQIDSSQILIQATMPLYRSGADYSKAREAQQTVSQRRMELEEVRHKAHETANNAWQALVTAEAALDADKAEVEAATDALDGVRAQNRAGTRTVLDVLNAQQELLDAQVDKAKSQHDRDLAILQIQAAIGELNTDHLQLAVEPYDPTRHYKDVRHQWIGFSHDEERYRVKPKPISETASP